jgi:hypothetical protein
LELRYLAADRLPYQTLFDRVANHTVLAERPPAAALGYIGGVKAMEYLAATALRNRLPLLIAEVDSGIVQV